MKPVRVIRYPSEKRNVKDKNASLYLDMLAAVAEEAVFYFTVEDIWQWDDCS